MKQELKSDNYQLKKIDEGEIAIIGTINDALSLKPEGIKRRFEVWISKISDKIFNHGDSRSLSHYYSIEMGSEGKYHLHFILFRSGIQRETGTHGSRVLLAKRLEGSYPFKADLKITPYNVASKGMSGDWIDYITKGSCEHSFYSRRLLRELMDLDRTSQEPLPNSSRD